jgi:hypothetical protein
MGLAATIADSGWVRTVICQDGIVTRTYWLDLFTVEGWKEFQDHSRDLSSFRESCWPVVQR